MKPKREIWNRVFFKDYYLWFWFVILGRITSISVRFAYIPSQINARRWQLQYKQRIKKKQLKDISIKSKSLSGRDRVISVTNQTFQHEYSSLLLSNASRWFGPHEQSEQEIVFHLAPALRSRPAGSHRSQPLPLPVFLLCIR